MALGGRRRILFHTEPLSEKSETNIFETKKPRFKKVGHQFLINLIIFLQNAIYYESL